MKKIILVIILLFIQKNVYSENLFDTSLLISNLLQVILTMIK